MRARGWGSTPSRQSACERALRWASGCDRRTASTERCSHRWTRERPYSRQSDTRRQVPRPRRTRETVWTASWPTTTSSLIVAKYARCRRYAGSCVLAGPKPRPTAPAHIIHNTQLPLREQAVSFVHSSHHNATVELSYTLRVSDRVRFNDTLGPIGHFGDDPPGNHLHW